MKGGDIILTPLPQADGQIKNRPALILCSVPSFGDLLVCGISTQLRQAVEGFDEMISPADADFARSGLVAPSLIRLGFVTTVPQNAIKGLIGSIASERHHRLTLRLAAHLSAVAI